MKDFVVLATFTYPYEYSVLKLLLEKENIRYVFENETMVTISPFYSNALGGIKLKVHKNDVEIANKLLKDFNGNSNLKIV